MPLRSSPSGYDPAHARVATAVLAVATFCALLLAPSANRLPAGTSAADDGKHAESTRASAYDYSRSFLRWTSTKNNHSPRLQIDAACTLTRDGRSSDYFLSAMCTGETMYADKNLIHLPANEFAMVCESNKQFMFFKWFAAPELNVIEPHRVGEVMTTQDGKGSRIEEMPVHMAYHARVRPLTTYAEIREAILGNKRLNGRTEYLGEDGKTTVVLNFPIKICNIAHGRERWQIDTPILLPDLAARAELPIGVFRMGYIVFNSWDWAEVILRKPGKQPAGKSAFTESRRLTAKNQLFCVD